MKYRKFGKLDFNVSSLGFGAMRLPMVDGNVDEKEATKMLYYAIDNGVNYVDTAYMYHFGQSEEWLGKISKSYKEKVKFATKLPSWSVNERSDIDKYFNEQLKRLNIECIDFYLLHALNKKHWSKLKNLGIIEWAEKKIKSGQIGSLGFSFHDDHESFKNIINDYDWTFCQIQYNYMDIENQAGKKGLEIAASKNIAIIVMEPLLGGKLVNPPEVINKIWKGSSRDWDPVKWALQWLWDQKEISTILSGMSTFNQVKENIEYANQSGINILSNEELDLYNIVREEYKKLTIIPCTKCGYCMPCPSDVNIPYNIDLYNQVKIFEKIDNARGNYSWMEQAKKLGIASKDERAKSCIQCGECEPKCPQNIPIMSWMKIIHEVLGEGKPYRENL